MINSWTRRSISAVVIPGCQPQPLIVRVGLVAHTLMSSFTCPRTSAAILAARLTLARSSSNSLVLSPTTSGASSCSPHGTSKKFRGT